MLIASPLALLGALLGTTEVISISISMSINNRDKNQAEDRNPMNAIQISPKLNTRHTSNVLLLFFCYPSLKDRFPLPSRNCEL
jgi:hypothetical protein